MIDVYTCPARSNGALPIAYMIAVMSQAAEGYKVESCYPGCAWKGVSGPTWDWTSYDYRIKRPTAPEFKVGDYVVADGNVYLITAEEPTPFPHFRLERSDTHRTTLLHISFEGVGACYRAATPAEIAAYKASQKALGHNPDNLTVAQVGEGYRLLDKDEIDSRPCRSWTASIHRWNEDHWDTTKWLGHQSDRTFRTRLSRAELAALDTPKKVPLTPADLASVCWIRLCSTSNEFHLVTSILKHGVRAGDLFFCFDKLMNDEAEYSPDRVKWYPCHKLV